MLTFFSADSSERGDKIKLLNYCYYHRAPTAVNLYFLGTWSAAWTTRIYDSNQPT